MKEPADVDALHADLLRAGEGSPGRVEAVFAAREPGEESVLALLRRALPVKTLEFLARTKPWSQSSRVLAGVVLNPKAPPSLSLPLVSLLLWRSLADVAVGARVPPAVRLRAESALKDQLPDLRLGERITLGRLATSAVLKELLIDTDPRVLESSLGNPRLTESDLLTALRRPGKTTVFFEAVAASTRWQQRYAVRVALAVEPRCPLGVALAQLSALLPGDLRRVAETPGLAALVQAAALRVVRERRDRDP